MGLSRILVAAIVFLVLARPQMGEARGDLVLPLVLNGTSGDVRFQTRLAISNLSQVKRITKVTVLFFRPDGTAWSIPTNLGLYRPRFSGQLVECNQAASSASRRSQRTCVGDR